MANELDIFRGMTPEFRDLFGMSRRLNRFFEDFGERSPWMNQSGIETEQIPKTELQETEDHYVLSCEMPGVPKDAINVEIRGNRLHISGERRTEIKGKKGEYAGQEYGRFSQVLTLPDDVDAEEVEAEYKDGVLLLAVPKGDSQKTKKVEIGSGEKGVLAKLKGKITGSLSGKTQEGRTQETRDREKSERAA